MLTVLDGLSWELEAVKLTVLQCHGFYRIFTVGGGGTNPAFSSLFVSANDIILWSGKVALVCALAEPDTIHGVAQLIGGCD